MNAFCTFASAAESSQSIRMLGSIDSHYSITMLLEKDGQKLSGSYRHNSAGKPLKLLGSVDDSGNVALQEFGPKGNKTGSFKGHFIEGVRIVGLWSKTKKNDSPLPFLVALDGNPNALAGGKDGIIITERIKKISKSKDFFLNVKFSLPIVAVNMLDNTKAATHLQASLAPKQIYNDEVAELVANPKRENLWRVADTTYKIIYNRNYLLAGDFTVSEYAARPVPSAFTEHRLISTKTGLRIKLTDAFLGESVSKLKSLLKEQMTKEEAKSLKKFQSDSAAENKIWKEELAEGHDISDCLTNFQVDDTGVTFFHDWRFPGPDLSVEPEGRYFFSWQQLKPFIRKDGPFGFGLRK